MIQLGAIGALQEFERHAHRVKGLPDRRLDLGWRDIAEVQGGQQRQYADRHDGQQYQPALELAASCRSRRRWGLVCDFQSGAPVFCHFFRHAKRP